MSITYNEVLNRLIEERKHLGLSQMEMAQFVYITQSNYSKVEKGLHRLSFKELKGLSQTDIDLMYIFTGNRCNGKYIDYFQNIHVRNFIVIYLLCIHMQFCRIVTQM